MCHPITKAKLFLRLALTLLLLTVAPTLANSAGFQESYKAATGDLNGDGLQDIYLKAETDLVLIPLVSGGSDRRESWWEPGDT